MRAIFMEENGTDSFKIRYPYSRKAVSLLTTLIPSDRRKHAFDPATASWTFPIEFWDDVLGVMEQVYPDTKLFVVDELPEYVPYDPTKEDQ